MQAARCTGITGKAVTTHVQGDATFMRIVAVSGLPRTLHHTLNWHLWAWQIFESCSSISIPSGLSLLHVFLAASLITCVTSAFRICARCSLPNPRRATSVHRIQIPLLPAMNSRMPVKCRTPGVTCRGFGGQGASSKEEAQQLQRRTQHILCILFGQRHEKHKPCRVSACAGASNLRPRSPACHPCMHWACNCLMILKQHSRQKMWPQCLGSQACDHTPNRKNPRPFRARLRKLR